MPRPLEIKVVGRGSFPIDMLRYDSCIPHDETDSAKIHTSIAEELGVPEHEPIKLDCLGRSGPTLERWASFGWRVLVGG